MRAPHDRMTIKGALLHHRQPRGRDQAVANSDAHGPAHEGEVEPRHDVPAAHLAVGDEVDVLLLGLGWAP